MQSNIRTHNDADIVIIKITTHFGGSVEQSSYIMLVLALVHLQSDSSNNFQSLLHLI